MNLKKITALVLAVLTIMLSSSVMVYAQTDIPFTDVKKSDWFYDDVRLAYEIGLINGKTTDTFAPNDYLKYSEAVKIAACMRIAYFEKDPLVVSGRTWYEVYVDYCRVHGIITKGYAWESYATRGDYMTIFANALPDDALKAINHVDDGAIPDVSVNHQNAEGIYKLYRAGVVQGTDSRHNCSPSDYVKRSEVSAILTRMMRENVRLKFTLRAEETSETTQNNTGSSNNNTGNSGSSNNNTGGSNSGNGTGSSNGGSSSGNTGTQQTTYPWEKPGAKKPADYTWEEYDALTDKQREVFQSTFGSMEAFDAWLEKAYASIKRPWENGGKKPSDYTYAEYAALNGAQQMAFQQSFGSLDAFEAWLEKAQGGSETVELPWENGGKQPSQYTYAEFERLTAAQQIAFQQSFGSTEAFDAWLKKVQGGGSESAKLPWENGGKQPSQYTYAEYEALTAAQQMAFQQSFGSLDAFDAWLHKAQDDASEHLDLPWENGGKQPSQYTYAEFERLTAAQQMAFQQSFSSVEAFDAWLQKAQGDGGDDTTDLPWENGGKQPSQYTYAEFERLNAAQQMAFQQSFGSMEAFDAWLQRAQGGSDDTYLPWENGGKQPSQYSYAEFERLNAAQQMAFQQSFGSIEAFDTWLQNAQGGGSDDLYLPWENGGKQPSQYSYAEFEALDAGQQMAFQNSFGSFEAFDAWLQRVNPQ